MTTQGTVGADPDGLDRFASTLTKVSRNLAAADRDVLALVRSTAWRGPEADRFRSAWPSTSGASLRRAAGALEEMAHEVKRQAAEQRRASSAGSGSWLGGIGGWVGQGVAENIALAQWIKADGRPAIDRLRTGTAKQQRAWWASLTDEQRNALLRDEPGRLTGLKGLDPAVLLAARESYFKQSADEIALRKDTTTVSGGIRIPLKVVTVDLGASGSAAVTEMADGSATVTLSLSSKVAAQFGLEKVADVEGFRKDSVEGMYRFGSKEEADAFLKGLRDEAIPKGKEIPLSLFVPGYAAGDVTHDVVNYLKKNDGSLESMTAGVAVGGGVSFGAGENKVALEGGYGARHDFVSGDTTVYYRGSGDASGGLGAVGFKAASEVEAGATVSKDGELSSLSLSGSLQGTGGPSIGGFTAQEGAQGSFDAKVDVTDPAVREAAKEYLSAVSDGDAGEANRHLSTLLANADVKLAVDQVSAESTEFDASVAYGGVDRETSTNKLLIVRPPGGEWMRYEAPRSAGGGGGGGGSGAW